MEVHDYNEQLREALKDVSPDDLIEAKELTDAFDAFYTEWKEKVPNPRLLMHFTVGLIGRFYLEAPKWEIAEELVDKCLQIGRIIAQKSLEDE